jgi:LEA14-like dessication related protein
MAIGSDSGRWGRARRQPVRRRSLPAVVLVLALAGAGGAAGCSAAFQQPEVEFDGVRIGSIGLRGGVLYARIHIANPNRFAFETQSLTYDLELRAPAAADREPQWVRLAEGTFADAIHVPARGSTTVEVPVEFTYAALDGALRSVLDRGSVAYRVAGVVTLRDPVRRQVPYRRSGVVTLSGAS